MFSFFFCSIVQSQVLRARWGKVMMSELFVNYHVLPVRQVDCGSKETGPGKSHVQQEATRADDQERSPSSIVKNLCNCFVLTFFSRWAFDLSPVRLDPVSFCAGEFHTDIIYLFLDESVIYITAGNRIIRLIWLTTSLHMFLSPE